MGSDDVPATLGVVRDATARITLCEAILREVDKRVIELQSRIKRLEARAIKQEVEEKRLPGPVSGELETLSNQVEDLTRRLKQVEHDTMLANF